MLIARAPLRVSFGGGGTDLAAYYTRYGGLVVSAAINRYCFVMLNDNAADLQIISADYASFHRQPAEDELEWDGELGLPRAVVHHFGIRQGLNLFLASEVPPGTGLGSSSAMTVSLVTALSRLRGTEPNPREVAELAAYLEIEKLGAPIGKQDHYAAAFGGLNVLTFHASGVEVEPVSMRPDHLAALERSLMLFFTGAARNSSTILRRQRQATERNAGPVVNSLHAIKRAAVAMREALEQGDLEAFGQLVDFAWAKKRQLSPHISNLAIDNCYNLAREEGAWGGKITGAGGGGFLLLCAPEERHERITATLEANGLRRMDCRFDFEGAQVVVDDLKRLAPAATNTDLTLAGEGEHQPVRRRARYRVVGNEPDLAEGRPQRARAAGSPFGEEVS
jgi:D-glycero-alpha-D-manno-heptose-7-phosphate kinase